MMRLFSLRGRSEDFKGISPSNFQLLTRLDRISTHRVSAIEWMGAASGLVEARLVEPSPVDGDKERVFLTFGIT